MASKITIYTDGSALGNPGPGGYGVVMLSGIHRKELSHGFRLTTNNRMELLAVIVGLQTIKVENAEVTIYSDSKYVVEAIEKGWLWNWVRTNFKDKKNSDLWKELIPAYKKHRVKLVWIKGHSSIPENERCDRLAVAAANQTDLEADKGYEQTVLDTLL